MIAKTYCHTDSPASAAAATAAPVARITPCFTPGTGIATPLGLRPVESLNAGDRVLTRDNGLQEISWIGARRIDAPTLTAARTLRPIMIRAGALGPGLPQADMLVSPDHRVLICDRDLCDPLGEAEVLVRARDLLGRPGVYRAADGPVTYVHFMLDRHEIVLSNGAWTESFHATSPALSGLEEEQRGEILTIFPELAQPAARPRSRSARRLVDSATLQTT